MGKQEVEAQWRPFYSTREREVENYLCSEMIYSSAGERVVLTDTCDAKKIIGHAVRVSSNDVIDTFWPLMTAEKILRRSAYHDSAEQRFELKELIENITSLVA